MGRKTINTLLAVTLIGFLSYDGLDRYNKEVKINEDAIGRLAYIYYFESSVKSSQENLNDLKNDTLEQWYTPITEFFNNPRIARRVEGHLRDSLIQDRQKILNFEMNILNKNLKELDSLHDLGYFNSVPDTTKLKIGKILNSTSSN